MIAGHNTYSLRDLVTGGAVDGSDFERHLLRYAAETLNLTLPTLETSLQRTRPEHWETLMGTVAETWVEQGKAAGIAEGLTVGLAEGKAATLLRQARLKFGALPDARVAQVQGANQDQLDSWLDALILAEDLDAVFGGRDSQ